MFRALLGSWGAGGAPGGCEHGGGDPGVTNCTSSPGASPAPWLRAGRARARPERGVARAARSVTPEGRGTGAGGGPRAFFDG